MSEIIVEVETLLDKNVNTKQDKTSVFDMGTNTGHVMTLANSIIGVSVLAMPFCFKQCGVVLASLMLILSSIMTRLACHYLIKSATLARRRTFEFLAFHTFGPTGKMTVELSIIGFMLGTCIAFFVVVGDLGPAIVSPALNIDNPSSIRASVLTAIALFVVLPLGLLRNVDSLAAISAATIAFYICLVLKVMGEATTHLAAWDWTDKVELWRPAGLLQCIPIFSMALSCQTQLFEIFDSIPNASLEKMNAVVKTAINLCTLVYMIMGFFGYIAFCTQPFSGNLMLSFSETPTSEVIKLGFVLSVAVSFPLVIFPCRASLHSLLFRRGIPPHYELMATSNHIPETRFKFITLLIVTVSLITGIMIPNIELVLGLVGSTIGVLICIIIPAALFLRLSNKNNNERLLAQVLFFVGLLIMILGSYANLYATEEAIVKNEQQVAVKLSPPLPTMHLLPEDAKAQIKDDTLKEIKNVEQLAAALPNLIKETPAPPKEAVAAEEKPDIRKEPPVPEAPEVKVISEASPVDKKNLDVKELKLEEVKIPLPEVVKEQPIPEKKEDVINHEALKKEDDEIKEVQKQEILKKKDKLLEKLEENEQKQQVLLEEQKKILQDIKIERKKLIEENKLNKEEMIVDKKKQEEKLNLQNEIIDKPKEIVIPVNNLESPNNNLVVEDKVDIKPVVKLDNFVNSIIKDDIVKRNMAEGVPIPIAIHNVMPRVDGVKAVKVIDNVENPNEGKADSKVLRREILEQDEVKEQREKRDVEEVVNIDLKENQKSLEKEAVIKSENPTIQKEDVLRVEKNVLVKSPQINFTSSNVDLRVQDLPPAVEKSVPKKDVKSSILTRELPLKVEDNEIEQCDDKSKPVQNKLLNNLEVVNKEVAVEVKNEGEVQKKVATSLNGEIKVEKLESLIKTPVYLSDPKIVLPAGKLLENDMGSNSLINVVKPMKRDLKSIITDEKRPAKEK